MKRDKPQIKLITLWVLDNNLEYLYKEEIPDHIISNGIWETHAVEESDKGRFYTMICIITYHKKLNIGEKIIMHEDLIIYMCHQIKIIHLPKLNAYVDMKKGKWYTIDVCKLCLRRLHHDDIFDNDGVCPHCGHDFESTNCKTEKLIIRKITYNQWWEFWKWHKWRKPKFEGKTDLSKKWLLTLDD